MLKQAGLFGPKRTTQLTYFLFSLFYSTLFSHFIRVLYLFRGKSPEVPEHSDLDLTNLAQKLEKNILTTNGAIRSDKRKNN